MYWHFILRYRTITYQAAAVSCATRMVGTQAYTEVTGSDVRSAKHPLADADPLNL